MSYLFTKLYALQKSDFSVLETYYIIKLYTLNRNLVLRGLMNFFQKFLPLKIFCTDLNSDRFGNRRQPPHTI